jgi:hypothetical protein
VSATTIFLSTDAGDGGRNDMNLTMHARQRMRQRGISRETVDYVLSYGRVSHDNRGGRVIWLDKRSRARMGKNEGRRVLRKLDKGLNAYVVTDADGRVVTVGHRYRRIRT